MIEKNSRCKKVTGKKFLNLAKLQNVEIWDKKNMIIEKNLSKNSECRKKYLTREKIQNV